jgi:hypothetical protein
MDGSMSSFVRGKRLAGFSTKLPSRLITKIPFFDGEFVEIRRPRYKWICLSSRFDVQALVDARDYEWVTRYLWCHTYGKDDDWRDNKIYARRAVHTPSGNKTVWMHREILERFAGPPPSVHHVGDHINGDSLDNRRENLRWATQSMNSRNRHGLAWRQPRLAFAED